jgi:ketosteroid isomerase-like protein
MNTAPEARAVVQSAYAAFSRGDIPAVLDLIADDVEWKFCGSKGLPYTGTFRGKDEVAKFFASIPEVEDLLVFEPREYISAGEKVAVLGWERSQVRSGGKVFESEWVHLFTTRDGRIVRFWGMYDTEAAAAARA